MDKKKILEKIYTTDDLMAMPEVISEILQAAESERLSTRNLTKIIQKDPAITAKVLKLANSPSYKRPTPIRSVNDAVSILGLTTVKCLALSLSIFNHNHIAAKSGIKSQNFFAYILLVAAACELVAQYTSYPVPEEALVAGLMHDIGIIFLLRYFPDTYGEVIKQVEEGKNIFDVEMSTFGIDHTEIGYHITQLWNIPENIVNAIRDHHHQPLEDPNNTLASIIKLSVLLTFNKFSGAERSIEERLDNINILMKNLGLSYQQITEIAHNIVTLMGDIAESLNIEVENTESLLSKANQEIWKSYIMVHHLFREREEINAKLLTQERFKAAVETRDKSVATLSHYLNNSVMAISGQIQLLYMLHQQNQDNQISQKLPLSLEIISNSINKILAVMEEMKEISPLDHDQYFSKSYAMNIDSRIEQRLQRINKEQFTIVINSSD